jgi:hypothetical protein
LAFLFFHWDFCPHSIKLGSRDIRAIKWPDTEFINAYKSASSRIIKKELPEIKKKLSLSGF